MPDQPNSSGAVYKKKTKKSQTDKDESSVKESHSKKINPFNHCRNNLFTVKYRGDRENGPENNQKKLKDKSSRNISSRNLLLEKFSKLNLEDKDNTFSANLKKRGHKFSMQRNKSLDRFNFREGRHLSLLGSQCSSLRSSVSSIISLEDSDHLNYSTNFKNRDCSQGYREKHKPGINIDFSNNNIEKLMRSNDQYLIQYLVKSQNNFKDFLSTHKSVNQMSLIFPMLCRIGDLEDSAKEFFLPYTCNEIFLENLSNYVSHILLQFTGNELSIKCKELLHFFSNIITVIPNDNLEEYCEFFNSTLSKLEKIGSEPDITNTVKTYLEKISDKIDFVKKDIVNSLNIFPTSHDLLEHPELEPNVVKGPYKNASDYIIRHFKLYKEDFVFNLRSGLEEYFQNLLDKNKRRLKDVFIYDAIYCGFKNHSQKNNLCLSFEIDNKKLKKVDWQTSRRLIHGSLLLISNDNFKTYRFLIIDDRNVPKNDEYSIVITALIVDKCLNFNEYTRCQIIESRVFFEPYFQVLKAFKTIDPASFPMDKYIIQVNSEVQAPKYVSENGNIVMCHDLNSNLNESQFLALKASLTKELVLIQGPPGTGKSYLGIKIINILLENKFVWNYENYSPILIICYRNNAVDQILNAVINMNKTVIRLGNRSSNEKVNEFNLRKAVKHLKSDIVIDIKMKTLKNSIKDKKNEISKLHFLIESINSKSGILNITSIRGVLSEKQIQFLEPSNVYENWLLGGTHENDNLINCGEDIFISIMSSMSEYSNSNNSSFLIYINDLKNELFNIKNDIFQVSESNIKNPHPNNFSVLLEMFEIYGEKEAFLKKVINRINLDSDNMIDPLHLNSKDLEDLSITERWKLYEYWVNLVKIKCYDNIEKLVAEITKYSSDLEVCYDISDGLKICQLKPDVVGATTTGAARLHNLMKTIKPKIVVIEEAAEILEPHTIAALTPFCEHLIMIGDHQQLRPNPASHVSVIKHKMDISLFERLINNGIEYFRLNEQHRMRPLISSLVIPLFYPHLLNHKDVENYPDIKGLKDNMFFIDHDVPEDELLDSESHRNKHEANFIIHLAQYILKQGYKPEDITIITFYSAQLLYIREIRPEPLKKISIEVIDNYQGEENKIILLSMVRSNPHSIGFLSKKNRICVALTRAREGFYLIGDMTTLKSNSSVWKEIDMVLQTHNVIGRKLPLKCNTHGIITLVECGKDFLPLKHGGCTMECGMELVCGHKCELQCHGTDENHVNTFSCRKPCERKRNCGIHNCTALCGEDCPLCDVQLKTELRCGHDGFKICAGEDLPCKSKCSELLSCGHPCSGTCHFPIQEHAKICKHPCGKPNKECKIGHKCVKPCGTDCGECIVNTTVKLSCGHLARGKCNNIKNVICSVLIDKVLDCGHTVKSACYLPISEVKCTEILTKELSCGHEIDIACSESKEEVKCEELIKIILACGHAADVPCHMSGSEEIFCFELVEKKLDCEHGFKLEACSTPQDDVICCKKVKKTLECGHIVKVLCHQKSKHIPCPEPCQLINKTCGHKCSGLCGAPCPPCTEPKEISLACGHTGTLPCSISESDKDVYLEQVECQKACKEKLKCGHQCVGTCHECMEGHIHKSCFASCHQTLLCGHKCSQNCRSAFHLCYQNCLNACKHTRCAKKCCEKCSKCRAPCDWKCEHSSCSKQCWEPCDRLPCEAACKKIQKCGHACQGLCGESCPEICYICFPDKYLNTKYVLSEDCGHAIPLSQIKMVSFSSNLGIFLCPQCQVPMTVTNYTRYYTKHWFDLLPKIKNILGKEFHNVKNLKSDLKCSLKMMKTLLDGQYNKMKDFKLLLRDLIEKAKDLLLSQDHNLTIGNIRSSNFGFFFLIQAINILTQCQATENPELLMYFNRLSLQLKQANMEISRNQMCEFMNELYRFSYICKLTSIGKNKGISVGPGKEIPFNELWKIIPSIRNFNEDDINRVSLAIKQIIPESNIVSDSFVNSKLFLIYKKYFELTLHRSDWVRCAQKNHLFYNHKNLDKSINCPTCSNPKKEFL